MPTEPNPSPVCTEFVLGVPASECDTCGHSREAHDPAATLDAIGHFHTRRSRVLSRASPWEGATPPRQGGGAANMNGRSHGGSTNTKDPWRDNYETPEGVLEIVRQRIGVIHLDAAALETTNKGISYIGPDHQDPSRLDALSTCWISGARQHVGCSDFIADNQLTAFLNPPFGAIYDFAKAAHTWGQQMTVAFLSYGRAETLWWNEFIHAGACEVIHLTPRVRYVDPRTRQLRKGSPNIHSAVSIWRPYFTGPPRVSTACWTDFQPKP